MEASTILEGLDEAQRRAATTLQGPVRIIAGAGAGKTRTVTRRIAYACATGAWDASRTLAVTFSVKAAAEMRARLTMLGVAGQVTAATFHSAALRQLRGVWMDICEAPFPHLVEDQRDLVVRAFTRASGRSGMDPTAARDVQAEINWAKISMVSVEDYAHVAELAGRVPPAGLDAKHFADIYDAYEQEKTGRGEIDFDDILLLTCHVLDDFPDAAAQIRSSIGWLTVDEYQDVSPLQHRLMTLWLGEGERGALNRNICVVGDPAQTIYSFAGASSYDLLAFADEFGPLSADIGLGTDYRSTARIVDYANTVLAASPDRQDYLMLTSARETGARIERTVYDSDQEEAQAVAARIAQMVAHDGVRASDCAILTRINAQQRLCCAALRSEGLRHRVRRDTGWQTSTLSNETAQRQALLEALGIAAGLDTPAPGETSVPQDATDAAAKPEPEDSGVTVSTIHAAKGLEFKHVFLIGCSEGLLPYGAPAPGDALEEERRLMYVAVTRAEDSLHLSYARSKDGYGAQRRRASRFLV
ncbi:ATP-dependent helicase [Bifidobacterium eulemuris]|uniref:DNA 3'-5' helicase n=1 Tax=Bifidobacterium eulemuris TaxID=1765219 RepID=A0A261G790_9BIFI|nr:ATP-dependent helicase [Bifidobacterium eulemuris]OZG67317.1 DNA helicase II [Bifidobacterium eulemuris]QOL32899.1 ATP-dependent helicase [Bifidobacterium eulemuris]